MLTRRRISQCFDLIIIQSLVLSPRVLDDTLPPSEPKKVENSTQPYITPHLGDTSLSGRRHVDGEVSGGRAECRCEESRLSVVF